jgi:hypothetical protein
MFTQYVACDGSVFDSAWDCKNYEEELNREMSPYPTPEQIARHDKQVAENNLVKEIVLDHCEKGKRYQITDLMYEIMPRLDFLRKRMTCQRLTQIVSQMYGDGYCYRTEEYRKAYFIFN